MSKVSPVQRTLAELRKRGHLAAVVEKWNPHAKIRQDLFGLIDIVSIYDGCIYGIQVCGGNGDLAAHLRKAEESPHFERVRDAFKLQVWTWRKLGARGKRKLWQRSVWMRGVDKWVDVTPSEDDQDGLTLPAAPGEKAAEA